MTDDLFLPTTPANPAATPSKCRAHRWTDSTIPPSCARCGKERDEARSRLGRNNRARGNREELTVARSIGGRKVGPLGHPWDVEIEGYMRLQVKKLLRWPSLAKVVDMIDSIPVRLDMRGAVIVQPGRGGRRLIVLDLDEFARWHGDPTTGESR